MGRRDDEDERPRRRKELSSAAIWIIVLASLVPLALCGGAGFLAWGRIREGAQKAHQRQTALPAIEVSAPITAAGIEFSDWRWRDRNGTACVMATIRAKGSLSQMRIRYHCYDDAGKKLGEPFLDYPNIQAGESADAAIGYPTRVPAGTSRIVLRFTQ